MSDPVVFTGVIGVTATTEHAGYARKKTTGEKGDIVCLELHYVDVITHSTQRRKRWKLGEGKIELIEFGSFNPRNRNYVKGGKVLEVR